jgi:hypothetical protein
VWTFFEILYYWDEYLCINTGWETDEILLEFTTAVNFQDCYKNLLLTYCDWSNWTGNTAKWIDSCENSSSEEIDIWSITYDASTDYYGTGMDGTQATCWPGYIGDHKYTIANYVAKNVFTYLKSRDLGEIRGGYSY